MAIAMNRRLKHCAFAGVALICVAAGLVFIPAPLSGNWISGKGTLNCLCDSHNFIRFEDGKILLVRSAHPPAEWIGEYRHTCFGTYSVDFWGMDTQTVHPGFLAVRPIYSWFLFRDPSWSLDRRILARPEQQQVTDLRWHLELREANGAPQYSMLQQEIPFQKVRRFIERLRTKPDVTLSVYTDLKTLPNELQVCLAETKVKYEIKPIKLLRRAPHAH